MNIKITEHDYLATFVLIDTWWNVNVNGKGCTREFEIVLIDTWWNVNDWRYMIHDVLTLF